MKQEHLIRAEHQSLTGQLEQLVKKKGEPVMCHGTDVGVEQQEIDAVRIQVETLAWVLCE